MTATKKTVLKQLLAKHSACKEAVKWAADFETPNAAWLACSSPEWMLWAINAAELLNDKQAGLFSCWCVRNTPLADGRKAWDLLADERSRKAVEVAEAFAEGKATVGELDAARDAARAAAGDAARAAAKAAQADQLRKMFGNPFTDANLIKRLTGGVA